MCFVGSESLGEVKALPPLISVLLHILTRTVLDFICMSIGCAVFSALQLLLWCIGFMRLGGRGGLGGVSRVLAIAMPTWARGLGFRPELDSALSAGPRGLSAWGVTRLTRLLAPHELTPTPRVQRGRPSGVKMERLWESLPAPANAMLSLAGNELQGNTRLIMQLQQSWCTR